MKRILAILLVLCLLPLAALAEECDVCSGDGVCDA